MALGRVEGWEGLGMESGRGRGWVGPGWCAFPPPPLPSQNSQPNHGKHVLARFRNKTKNIHSPNLVELTAGVNVAK